VYVNFSFLRNKRAFRQPYHVTVASADTDQGDSRQPEEKGTSLDEEKGRSLGETRDDGEQSYEGSN